MSEVKPNAATLPAQNFDSLTPTQPQVRDFVAALVHEVCDVSPELIIDSARIDHELEMESVQMVQLQVAIEQEFDITLDFLEILRLNTFGRIVDYIYAQASQTLLR